MKAEAFARAAPIAFGVYAVFAFVSAVLDFDPLGLRPVVAALANIGCNVVVAALAFRNARAPHLPARIRRTWRFFGVSSVVLVVGHILWSWQVVVLARPRVSPWFEAPFLAHYPFVLAGILSLPLALRSNEDRWRFFFDAATVMVAGAMGIWYFIVYPGTTAAPAAFATALLYSVGDLVLLLGIVTIWLRRGSLRGGQAVTLLGAGLFLSFTANVAYAWLVRAGSFTSGGVLHTLWVGATSLVAASAERQYREGGEGVEATATVALPLRPSLPPYVAIVLGYALLLGVAARDGAPPLIGLVAGALALTAVVVARQVAAVRDNLRLHAERSAQESEARFRALVQNSSDVISILDPDTTIRFASPAVVQVVGRTADELAGTRLADLIHPDDRERASWLIRDTARSGAASASAGWRFRHAAGSWVFTENIVTNLVAEPTVAGIVLNTRDVSDRRRLEEQLTWQAFHDPLTRLPNRSVFLDRVAHALARSERTETAIAVVFADLDNFKRVNDSLGHPEGDRVLVAAGERLIASVRSGDTVARLGGDEFALLIEDAKDPAVVEELAERIVATLAAPFELDDQPIQVGASIGIARSRQGETSKELLRNADVAMYVAKAQGKRRFQIFQPEMQAAVRDRIESETDLRRAIEAGEFRLYYQPILRLEDRKPVGFEGLLRWLHPVRGLVTPDAFISLAEETGLIVPLGRWAIHEACGQWRAWRDRRPASKVQVSINVSARHFQDASLVNDVRAALAEFKMPGKALVLEITESLLLQQTEVTREKLRELKGLGLSLAVDDFGTGYSSLGYLHRFPIDVLKIDKIFVEGMGEGTGRAAIARAIIGLADALGLKTVAEGIEREGQADALVALGCVFGQGYLFARPQPPEDLEPFLARAAGDAPSLPETGYSLAE